MFARNLHIANELEQLALLLEIDEANVFKIRAYKEASRVIRSLESPLSSIVQLDGIKGIGPGIKGVVDSIIKGEEPEELQKMRKKIPPSLLEIARLPGIGPKSLKTLWQNDILNIETLERKAREHQLRDLPGFGAKSEFKILSDLELYRGHRDLYVGGEALEVAFALKEKLLEFNEVSRVEITGELRRYEPLVSQIELLVEKKPGLNEKLLLESLGIIEKDGKMYLIVGYQVELHFVEPENFGSELLKTTGPAEFVNRFREVSNEAEEEKVFISANYNFVPAELRHSKNALNFLTKELPQLVELADIKGDLHMHSRYSDGALTIKEMASSAKSLGYQYIAICDHSRSLTIARGLTPERLDKQGREIEKLNEELKIKIFKGTEVDILKDGSLDFPEETLAKLDWVIASVHSNFRMDKSEMTKRLIKAIENPYVRAIGHISGRLLAKRSGYEFAWEEILNACKDTGTVLEINATPDRLDVPWEMLEACLDFGVKIVINTDAHSSEGLNNMIWGVMTARRGLVPKEQIINTYSLKEFKEWLKHKKS